MHQHSKTRSRLLAVAAYVVVMLAAVVLGFVAQERAQPELWSQLALTESGR